MLMKNLSLVILDRDGVINQDSPDYIKSPDEFVMIPGSSEAILRLNKAGIKVAVATNQSGVARGLYSEETLHEMHQKMHSELKKIGAHVDLVRYCPHHPDVHCACRKPNPGMLLDIGNTLNIDLKNALMIGDRIRDILAGFRAGTQVILIHEFEASHPEITVKFPVVRNLAEAVNALLSS